MDWDWLADPELPAATERLRLEVRSFLAEALKDYPLERRVMSWTHGDPAFSRLMGQQGYIGMTWPKRYGGGERTALERYVMVEEILAAGAPVAAHWMADRQIGPTLLRFGTEAQRLRFLPAIVRGEMLFCIGLSEPDCGSDLASVRTRAERADGGWRVSGTKLWISQAANGHFMMTLVRTEGTAESRHQGLSQLLIDLASPGVTVRPIRDLGGESHFAEVVLDEVFVPADMLVGQEGGAWKQVMSELSNERSGPERFLSSLTLLMGALDVIRDAGLPGAEEEIGRITADMLALRAMSISVAQTLQAGGDPTVPAALVKDLGSVVEQEIPVLVQRLSGREPNPDGDQLERALARLTQLSVIFSLRGGTREILKGIIARDLGGPA